jgi:hypothetical protein
MKSWESTTQSLKPTRIEISCNSWKIITQQHFLMNEMKSYNFSKITFHLNYPFNNTKNIKILKNYLFILFRLTAKMKSYYSFIYWTTRLKVLQHQYFFTVASKPTLTFGVWRNFSQLTMGQVEPKNWPKMTPFRPILHSTSKLTVFTFPNVFDTPHSRPDCHFQTLSLSLSLSLSTLSLSL